MNRPSIKCVMKNLFCFLFEFNENWWSCRYLCVLKLQQVSLNLNEKQKRFFNDNLTNGLSVKGRWIWPKNVFEKIAKNINHSFIHSSIIMLCNNCLHTISFQEKYPNYWYYHFFCNFPRIYSLYFLLKQNNIFISLLFV